MNKNAWIGLLLIALTFSALLNLLQFALSFHVESQPSGTAIIYGYVTNNLTKDPVPLVEVLVFLSESGERPSPRFDPYYSAWTDEKGFYTIQVEYYKEDNMIQAAVSKTGYTQDYPYWHELSLSQVTKVRAEWNFTMWELPRV